MSEKKHTKRGVSEDYTVFFANYAQNMHMISFSVASCYIILAFKINELMQTSKKDTEVYILTSLKKDYSFCNSYQQNMQNNT